MVAIVPNTGQKKEAKKAEKEIKKAKDNGVPDLETTEKLLQS